jgi:hypothetical protein
MSQHTESQASSMLSSSDESQLSMEEQVPNELIEMAISETFSDGLSTKEHKKAVINQLMYYFNIIQKAHSDPLWKDFRSSAKQYKLDNPSYSSSQALEHIITNNKCRLLNEMGKQDPTDDSTGGDSSSDSDRKSDEEVDESQDNRNQYNFRAIMNRGIH